MENYVNKIKYVVIVDDNSYKLNTIIEVMHKLLPTCHIHTGTCRNDMMRYLRENLDEMRKDPEAYLIITDMQMPVYEYGAIVTNCGFDVLRYLQYYRLKCPTIIASSDRINDEEALEYYDYYVGAVKHSAAVSSTSYYKKLLEEF